MSKPCFLVTIDTDGDNGRSGSRVATMKHARYVERFQDLCESYGLKPTYLMNREMAECPVFKGFAGWILARGAGEIGMHLHAGDSPRNVPITNGRRRRPHLGEYPERAMREKIRALTGVLEDTFGVKMVSHRAGRWGFDERYASMLLEAGYCVDCSVTPLWYWPRNGSGPAWRRGPDNRTIPAEAYWVDLSDISRAGDSPLLEVPMTILPNRRTAVRTLSDTLRRLPGPLQALTEPVRRFCDWVTPPGRWLRPNGKNGVELLEIVEQVLADGRSYAEFTLHSSELKLGGSRWSRSVAEIERLLDGLAVLFSAIRGRFRGVTLSEFHAEIMSREVKSSGSPPDEASA